MTDDAPFIDPELIAAGQLLKSHGLAALNPASSPIADVRAMQDRIGAFLGEGSTPLQRERDLVHRFDILVASGSRWSAEVGTTLRFEFEWQDATGVRDRLLAATWARLSLSVGDLYALEAIDLRSDSRRTGIYGSLFPLVEWLIEHWWHLLYEPSPCAPVPGGRAAPPLMRSWIQRHNLLAARDGGALPDLTIARDGDDVLVQWEPDAGSPIPTRVRFVGQGRVRVSLAEFERSVGDFVESVLARLEERFRSAGANLALAAALALRDAEEPVLSFLLLIYGVYSTNGDSDSWRRLGTGTYGLSRAQLSWIWENYLASPEQRRDVAPLENTRAPQLVASAAVPAALLSRAGSSRRSPCRRASARSARAASPFPRGGACRG